MEVQRSEICSNCGDRNCCRGLCKDLNDYLVKAKEKQRNNKTATEVSRYFYAKNLSEKKEKNYV